jgi:LysR family nitrogen assimilation transcriptional regulator
VAQPALGLQIRQLERELGVPLLIRHSRGVSPTEAGQQLYVRALEILDLVERARIEVSAASRNEREPIVLGLTNGTMALLGPNLIREAEATLPQLQLSLVEEMSSVLVDALDRGEVDIALAYDVPDRPNLLRIPLLEEEVLFVRAASEEPFTAPIAFSSVLALPLVLPNERDVIRTRVQAIANQLALPLRIGYEVSSINMLKRLVADGGSASVMPYATILDEVERGILRCRRIIDPTPKRILYLVRSIRRGHFAQDDELLDYLQAAVRNFLGALGELATPLSAMERPLSVVMERLSEEFGNRSR